MTLKRALIGIFILFLGILYLFWLQNSNRFPMMDANGNYLSFDLLFWGGSISEPISVATLMLISMVFGGILSLIVKGMFSFGSDEFQSSDY